MNVHEIVCMRVCADQFSFTSSYLQQSNFKLFLSGLNAYVSELHKLISRIISVVTSCMLAHLLYILLLINVDLWFVRVEPYKIQKTLKQNGMDEPTVVFTDYLTFLWWFFFISCLITLKYILWQYNLVINIKFRIIFIL